MNKFYYIATVKQDGKYRSTVLECGANYALPIELFKQYDVVYPARNKKQAEEQAKSDNNCFEKNGTLLTLEKM